MGRLNVEILSRVLKDNVMLAKFWDANIVKVLDGIAGSGKSSQLDEIFKNVGKDYLRFTSTNRLKRDAIARYGGHCDTIAGGLFETIEGEFFASEKNPAGRIVVIDEILQTDKRVLQWIENHKGECNIFVLTDTHQMLAPMGGASFLRAFEEFKKLPWVYCIDMPHTFRARDEKTETYYYECFKSVEENNSLFYQYKKTHKVIPFSEMPFNPADIYITHTNAIEKKLYQNFELGSRYDLELVPKGTISRKEPKTPQNYPILPQADVSNKLGGYYQLSMIGTPTRYQGSECKTEQKLYYIVPKGARVEPREWYTVVTRCYSLDSLQIVEAPRQTEIDFSHYWGKPVKHTEIAEIENEKLAENITGKSAEMPLDDIIEALKDVKDTSDTHYKRDCFRIDGTFVHEQKEQEEKVKPKITMIGLLKKCPEYSYSFLPSFYKRYEEIQTEQYSEVFSKMPCSVAMKNTIGHTAKSELKYGIDLQASYPHILKYAKLPIDSDFETDMQEAYLKSSEDFYSFCTVMNSKFIPDGCIISYETAELLADMDDDNAVFGWLGACKARRGSLMGNKLMDMATYCIESNNDRKAVRYGLAERQYVYSCEWDMNGDATAYAISEQDNHAPLMWAIKDAQIQIMLKIKRAIDDMNGRLSITVADGVFFNFYGSIKALGDRIKSETPWCDFRIYEQNDNDKNACVLYKTYEDLKSREEIRKERKKNRDKLDREKYRRTH